MPQIVRFAPEVGTGSLQPFRLAAQRISCSEGTELVRAGTSAAADSVNNIKDASMLRGVEVRKVLRGFGSMLRRPVPGSQYLMTEEDAEDLYEQSQKVEVIDYFLSHSWRDSRWLKYIAILWELNGTRAALYANVATFVYVFSIATGDFPSLRLHYPIRVYRNNYSVAAGYSVLVYAVVFIAVLFAGGNIHRSTLRKTFFLDKVCIHQTDPNRKAIGIRKLGGFLHKSQRLLVVLGHDYFSRLWCNYELASFAILRGLDSIDFVPIAMPAATFGLIFMSGIMCGIINPIFALLWPSPHNECGQIPFYCSVAEFVTSVIYTWLFTIPISLFFAYASRMHLQTSARFKGFRLADSECFCCSVDHTCPRTNQQIPCDRRFVEDHVRSWFREFATSEDLDGIDAFNRCTRNLLCGRAEDLLGPFCVTTSAILIALSSYTWDIIESLLLTTDLKAKFVSTMYYSAFLSHEFMFMMASPALFTDQPSSHYLRASLVAAVDSIIIEGDQCLCEYLVDTDLYRLSVGMLLLRCVVAYAVYRKIPKVWARAATETPKKIET